MSSSSRRDPGARTGTLSLGEAIVGGLALLLAAVAWSSTLLAHLGWHGLGAVAALTGGLLLAAGAWAALDGRPGVRPLRGAPAGELARGDRREVVALVLIGALACLLDFPGFPWVLGDRDPGVYLAHAAHIDRHGDAAIRDPVVEHRRELRWGDPNQTEVQRGSRFPGLWVTARTGRTVGLVQSQFYALYSATLATARALGGLPAALSLNGVCGVLAVLLALLVASRAAGPAAGAAAAALLAANPLQVWHARYPTSEALTEVLALAAVLALQLAVSERWRWAAGLAGVLVTLTFLARPDGLLLVLLALGGFALADWRQPVARHFLLGLALPLPHALLQSHHAGFNLGYSIANGLPGLPLLALAALATLALGVLVQLWRRRAARFPAWPAARAWRGWRWIVGGLGLALLVLALLRPMLFGEVLNRQGVRTWAEQSLWRLSWFLHPAGLALVALGWAWLCWRRWRPVAWLPVVTTALLLPLYLYNPRIQPGLMWWTRRFVPFTLPGLAILAAFGLVALAAGVAALLRRRYPRAATAVASGLAAVVCGALVATYAARSVALVRPSEMAGAVELLDELGQLAPGRQAIVLWTTPGIPELSIGFALGGPVWLVHDQISVWLPPGANPADVLDFTRSFPGRPLFLITDGAAPPPALAVLPWVLDRQRAAELWHLEETLDRVPSAVIVRRFPFTVWRLPTG